MESTLMPGTKRTPIARSWTPLITPQALDLYRRALKLRTRAHLSSADKYACHDAERDLDRALGIKLWDTSVFDTIGYKQPPAYMNADQREGWMWSMGLRQQLEAAVRQERTARRAKAVPPSLPPEPPPA
jgi:hypothetical protein